LAAASQMMTGSREGTMCWGLVSKVAE